jgi:hypothetical protein
MALRGPGLQQSLLIGVSPAFLTDLPFSSAAEYDGTRIWPAATIG